MLNTHTENLPTSHSPERAINAAKGNFYSVAGIVDEHLQSEGYTNDPQLIPGYWNLFADVSRRYANSKYPDESQGHVEARAYTDLAGFTPIGVSAIAEIESHYKAGASDHLMNSKRLASRFNQLIRTAGIATSEVSPHQLSGFLLEIMRKADLTIYPNLVARIINTSVRGAQYEAATLAALRTRFSVHDTDVEQDLKGADAILDHPTKPYAVMVDVKAAMTARKLTGDSSGCTTYDDRLIITPPFNDELLEDRFIPPAEELAHAARRIAPALLQRLDDTRLVRIYR
jgi:hypothetical protein